MSRFLLRSAVATAFVGLFGLVGCSRSDGLPTYPVAGTVRVNGQPAASALVTFHPLGGQSSKPSGRVGDDGTFALTTREGGDGAPAGEYRVTVAWVAPAAGRKGVEGEDAPPRPLVPAEYTTPDRTPLRASVAAGASDEITLTIARK